MAKVKQKVRCTIYPHCWYPSHRTTSQTGAFILSMFGHFVSPSFYYRLPVVHDVSEALLNLSEQNKKRQNSKRVLPPNI
ncbi:hypothetical protein [Sporomusa sp. GT1]|uniref:hypothetical protein n=1 Tax=Sporomusa sp. GT1 TaxID=1534747 RepID=UPI001662E3DB|nr:hypothetical protein [Sporomusa sp. GT1]